MPVPALPPSNTRRYWLVYTVNGATHRMQMRTNNLVDGTGANTNFQNLLNAAAPALFSLVPLTLELAEQGSDVRTLVSWTGLPSFGTGNGAVDDRRFREISFTGRSILGHKSRIHLYGVKDISEPDYRVDTTESTVVASIVTILNGAVNSWQAIDGSHPVWHAYANINFNDHWIKAARKVGG